MKHITDFVLKRPVTMLMFILCLIFFGYTSVTGAKLELSPDMDMPMLMVVTSYTGANPQDVNDLVTKKIEDQVGSLSGLKSITSSSNEGSSMVMLEYEYGTNTDDAYDDLKKKIDLIKEDLPDDCGTPTIVEMSMNSSADVTMSVNNSSSDNLYTYVEDKIKPEFEKIQDAADVSIKGGGEEYVKVEINAEKVSQYKLSMSSIASDIKAANITYPGGNTESGKEKYSVSTRMTYDTVESLKKIPLTVSGKNTVYLEDVANVYTTMESNDSIARYNGEDTVSLSVTKQKSATSVDLSNEVKSVISSLKSKDPDTTITIVSDNADSIKSSLFSVVETLLLAVLISMAIIWLFFGDIKASLIVGSSIPMSILTALILMKQMGFTLNVITLSALTLGVGMMVDNSIVVMESCFRVTADSGKKPGFVEYMHDALLGTDIVGTSIMGGTATTCVVFLPLASLNGMTGQMFKPLGWTIVFCMAASLLSAITVVPLCYMVYKPTERSRAPLSGPVKSFQNWYRKTMRRILPRRKTVMGISIALLVLAFYLASQLGTELMASDDQGQVSITVETRPGLQTDEVDGILKQVESVIREDQDLKSYMTSYGGSSMMNSSSSASITAYLKDKRSMKTSDVVKKWTKELSDIEDCNISVSMNSSMSMMSSSGQDYELILKGTDYDEIKSVSDKIVGELNKRDDVSKIHSSLENSSPVVEIRVDAVKAKAYGLSASAIGSTVQNMIRGITATDMEVGGNDIDVKVQYPENEYKTVDQVRSIILQTDSSGSVALSDLADISYVDSPATISRENKQYKVTISGLYTDKATKDTKNEILSDVVTPNLSSGVTTGMNSTDRSMGEEFAALFQAIGIAVFLIFAVMAAQFESMRYSFMVMTTIPFSLVGAFGFLWLADCKISMVSLVGFLMLIGTVVNNGILYVDTTNQYRATMDMDTALVEAGATRIRPILMTTLTTVISMIPMAFAIGNSGSMTQGLALVNIGGLTASTIMCLIMLPVYYTMMSKKKEVKA
jgi:multidrug efflux pump subunit AcrB